MRVSCPQLLDNSARAKFSSEIQTQSSEDLRYIFNITYVADMSCKVLISLHLLFSQLMVRFVGTSAKQFYSYKRVTK